MQAVVKVRPAKAQSGYKYGVQVKDKLFPFGSLESAAYAARQFEDGPGPSYYQECSDANWQRNFLPSVPHSHGFWVCKADEGGRVLARAIFLKNSVGYICLFAREEEPTPTVDLVPDLSVIFHRLPFLGQKDWVRYQGESWCPLNETPTTSGRKPDECGWWRRVDPGYAFGRVCLVEAEPITGRLMMRAAASSSDGSPPLAADEARGDWERVKIARASTGEILDDCKTTT